MCFLGVGLCKKSCKKRAAANLLSLMELKGMNIHFDRCFAVSEYVV